MMNEEKDTSQSLECLQNRAQDTITTLGAKEPSTRVLFYHVTMDIYDSTREQAVAKDPELTLQRLMQKIIDTSDAKMLTAYFQLQRIQFYLRKSTEPVDVESYTFLRDATVFSLGNALHDKFPSEKREGTVETRYNEHAYNEKIVITYEFSWSQEHSLYRVSTV